MKRQLHGSTEDNVKGYSERRTLNKPSKPSKNPSTRPMMNVLMVPSLYSVPPLAIPSRTSKKTKKIPLKNPRPRPNRSKRPMSVSPNEQVYRSIVAVV